MQDPRSVRHDAIVVGSGATGGWAAKKLSEAGLKVALLEAGRKVSPDEFAEHLPAYRLDYRNLSPEIVKTRPIQKACYACQEYNYDWFVNDLKNPYSTPQDKPFSWQRLRVVGGRTLVWGRQSYRMGDLDFKAASHDGYGEDWPISHADLAPYYDQVERYVGISGSAEGNPALPDSQFLPPMAMTCGEKLLRDRAASRFGRQVTIGRVAVLTQPHNGRAACHYCGPCHRGCVTHSYFSSPFTTVADALKTGNCTLITNAIVSHVELDSKTNRARGVTYVDRHSRKSFEISARVVVLAAQALESTRILFNSKTREHPTGVGNSSGRLGRYLMDHAIGRSAAGRLEGFSAKQTASDPQRPNGIYVIRFRNLDKDSRHPHFIRGYGFQGSTGPNFAFGSEGFGASYKEAVKAGEYTIALTGFGESLPRMDNYCEIDPDLRDAWGIPALRIHMSHGSNEKALMEDAAVTAAEMLEEVGAKGINVNSAAATPGMAVHEIGTARMGNDPKKSVLTAFNEVHDVKNLLVVDGACFVSSACQNPTLTMMAITVRACDHLLERFRRSEV